MLRKMRFHEQLIGGGFLVITVLFIGVGFLAWKTTKDVQGTSNAIMKENVTSLKAAEELELAKQQERDAVLKDIKEKIKMFDFKASDFKGLLESRVTQKKVDEFLAKKAADAKKAATPKKIIK